MGMAERINKIRAYVIPHDQHRYETVGDYWYPVEGEADFRVSDMGNEDFEFLVLIHELIEAHLCRKRGISEPEIKAFDEAFEAARAEGNVDEPGFDPAAPYLREHTFATVIEKLVAQELEVDWKEYDEKINSL
jgi:hypothetical protein